MNNKLTNRNWGDPTTRIFLLQQRTRLPSGGSDNGGLRQYMW